MLHVKSFHRPGPERGFRAACTENKVRGDTDSE